jgi:hypothetical protein
MDLVALAKSAQDADRVLDCRFAHHDRLESTLERRVLLDVLAVLVERRRANRVELAAREHRLQHVRRVDRPFGGAGTDHRMKFVDEEDDLALGIGDLLQHRLEALLELTAIFRARDQRAHVEPDDRLVLEPLGHVAAHDALRQALHDGGFTDPRLTNQDGVVLRATRQHLDHPTNLFVAADDRIELALLGQSRQIPAITLERLVLALRILVGHALAATNRRQRFEDAIPRQSELLEQPGGRGAAGLAGQGDEQVLRADVLVLQPLGFGFCQIDDELQSRRDRGRRATVYLRLLRGELPRVTRNGRRIELQFAKQCRDDAVFLLDQCDEQMFRLDLWMVVALGQLLGCQHGGLRLFGKSIEIHGSTVVVPESFSPAGPRRAQPSGRFQSTVVMRPSAPCVPAARALRSADVPRR